MSADAALPRKPRADGQRNRERLLEAAKAAFAELGPEVGLDEVARRAGVGIGTLYRHFPARDAIIQAVYQREVEQLADGAARLSETEAPADALSKWMRLFVDYIATKKVMIAALAAVVEGAPTFQVTATEPITEAMKLLVSRAIASGDIRADTRTEDVLRAVIGFAYGAASPDWQASALRLIDIFMDGLKVRPA